jgi:hypothetical protein
VGVLGLAGLFLLARHVRKRLNLRLGRRAATGR